MADQGNTQYLEGPDGDARGGNEVNARSGEFTFNCPSTTDLRATETAPLGANSTARSASSVEHASSATSSFIQAEDWDDSASLTDSVQTFPEEFGRTYHAYRAGCEKPQLHGNLSRSASTDSWHAAYLFPNDNSEQERLGIMGECYKLLMKGKLYLAPLSAKRPPRHILDIATGIGDWAIQMGDLFPAATVIGTDLSPIQPNDVPPNVYFYVEDSSDQWMFTQKFDYIHTRSTAGCWADFETQVAMQAFNALEPGGWFESQETDCVPMCDDDTFDQNGPVATWCSELIAAAEKLQRPAIIGSKLKEIYERVGFVDVHERVYRMPINGWAKDPRLKEVGWMWADNLLDGLSGFSYQLLHKAFERTSAQIESRLLS
ncbi:glycoside hydrolase family 76 [Fusarium beomiforme]|uniref:Glycoside hydrolase family 76 n=1 Tax=Fusarium beomiforme TaxID=44412 RepID=A0A9P5DTF0_9HYPO|nr:glycoside hydrolase family 76 [Fusarium beomiforme]